MSEAGNDVAPSSGDEGRGVLDLLADIKSGRVAARTLDPEVRRVCVEYLFGEGVQIAEIAQLLCRTERTVRRDLDEIRRANALDVDPGFADQIAGELLSEARVSIGRIRRVTREKDAPHAARIDGERTIVQILDIVANRLQSIGYLPSATQRIQAELTHAIEPLSFDAVTMELERLKGLESGARPEGPADTSSDTEHSS